MVDPATEALRQAYLEALYDRSGRSCSTYTGLFQRRQQELLERDMAKLLNAPA